MTMFSFGWSCCDKSQYTIIIHNDIENLKWKNSVHVTISWSSYNFTVVQVSRIGKRGIKCNTNNQSTFHSGLLWDCLCKASRLKWATSRGARSLLAEERKFTALWEVCHTEWKSSHWYLIELSARQSDCSINRKRLVGECRWESVPLGNSVA